MNPTVRVALPSDATAIFDMIYELAVYEKMENQVETSPDGLKKELFENHGADAFIMEENGKAIGYAIFFTSFSTFLGKRGIYLEDLYVKPDYRHKGYGKMLFDAVAGYTAALGFGRLEWSCLDWNKPSIDFYLSMKAVPLNDWTVYRLSGKPLAARKPEANCNKD